jgi:hypothetical protein
MGRRRDDYDEGPTTVLLRDYPFDVVRLACTKCERRGQYRKSTLIERFGPNYGLVSMRLDLAKGCPKIVENSINDLCGVMYPDLIGSMTAALRASGSSARHKPRRASRRAASGRL